MWQFELFVFKYIQVDESCMKSSYHSREHQSHLRCKLTHTHSQLSQVVSRWERRPASLTSLLMIDKTTLIILLS